METIALISAVLVFIYGICYEPNTLRKTNKKDNTY